MSYADYPITWLHSAPLLMITAILLDQWLGEPRRWHPLVGFGHMANWLEKYCKSYIPGLSAHAVAGRLIGLIAWLLLLLPLVALAYAVTHLHRYFSWGWLADLLTHCLLLYFAIGARSLKQHAMRIYHALVSKDLAAARVAVGMIVSRDTQGLDTREIASATVESVLENGNDAVFGALFWFLLLGGPGALLFRLANTLDAMWGYRTPRFVYFGWAAACIDDLLNLIPARLTALSYALCGATGNALRCWQAQAASWYSPNAGPVMASGAGALNVQLGGAAPYHGQLKARPLLGAGEQASPQHIVAAVRLVRHSMLLWSALAIVAALAGLLISETWHV